MRTDSRVLCRTNILNRAFRQVLTNIFARPSSSLEVAMLNSGVCAKCCFDKWQNDKYEPRCGKLVLNM